MNAVQRLKKLGVIEHFIGDGCHESIACAAAGATPAWYRRTKARLAEDGFDGLKDAPRTGRPRKNQDGK